MRDWKTREGVPFLDLSFEAQTKEYVRRWALNRRNFLAGSLAIAGAGLLTSAVRPAFAQQTGGHLIIGRAQGSDSLDNHRTSSIASSEVQRHIYDSLAFLEPRDGEIHPGLATSWSFEDDNKVVVFNLRPGVTFHDGTPFNADAVVRTVRRHRAPETASPSRVLLGPLDDVEEIDELTVAYRYTQPFVGMWASLLLVYTAPHSPTAAERYGTEFSRNPVGTGPFRFVSWDSNDVITLERNPDRDWESTIYENTGAPHLDSAEYRTIPEPSTRVASLISGEVDILAGTGDAVPSDSMTQLANTPGIRLISQTALGVTSIVFCQRVAPMEDVRVRQAIAHAIDREKILAFALDGRGQVATSPLGSQFLHYNPGTAETAQAYDPDRARALLAEAGITGGLELTYIGPDDTAARIIAESIQADLAAVGISLRIDSFPTAEFAALRGQDRYHFVYHAYSYSDADILRQMMASTSPISYARHSNARIDELAEAQGVAFDQSEREALLFELQEIAVEEVIWLPLVERQISLAMRDNVHAAMAAAGTLNLTDVWKS